MSKLAREQMKAEAVRRIKSVNLNDFILSNFERDELVISKNVATLFRLSDDMKAMVKEFEDDTGCLVYHVIHTDMGPLGTHYSFLNVSPYEDDWEMERECLKRNMPIVYVRNAEDVMLSDFGSIGIEIINGVPIRTA